MMELAVRAFGLWRQDTHFNSLSSNLFQVYMGQNTGLERVIIHDNEMGSTWGRSIGLKRVNVGQ
jgi:hypothetical protein